MTDILDEILNDEKDAKRLQIFRKILPIVITLTIITAIFMAIYSWFSQAKTHSIPKRSLHLRWKARE